METIIAREYRQVVGPIRTGLSENCVSATDQRAKDFFTAVETVLREVYQKSLPRRLQRQTQRDHRMVTSIQRVLKKRNIILRKTDKSKVSHLASAKIYHQKALDYMSKTNAYREIPDGQNPCMQHLERVKGLIDPMLKNKSINLKLWKSNMYPNADRIELAHLYFIPKPHKVRIV